jgi:hypothetical protein
MLAGEVQGLAELPCVHRRSAEISSLSGLYDIMQRLERLLDRRLVVPTMNLIQVDIIRPEPPQAGVDG